MHSHLRDPRTLTVHVVENEHRVDTYVAIMLETSEGSYEIYDGWAPSSHYVLLSALTRVIDATLRVGPVVGAESARTHLRPASDRRR